MKNIVSVIIPVFNEERTIESIIQKVKTAPLPPDVSVEIIVVNDGSTDKTEAVLASLTGKERIRVLTHPRNFGKTLAVKTGLREAKGNIVLIQDADLEYDPAHYASLIGPIINDDADVVYGSRFKGTIVGMAPVNRLANAISNLTFNILFGAKFTDINTCYKIFKKDLLVPAEITSRNFMFETEITAKFFKRKVRMLEVPINYRARSRQEGKKITWPKAVQMFWGIIVYRFSA